MKSLLVRIMLLVCTVACTAQETALPDAAWNRLPKWRGFNLTDKMSIDWANGPFQEEDFKLISEFGFNYARLPMDYRAWSAGGDWRRLDEKVLKEIDQAVEWGGKYGVHVCISFHRAPGYTVAKPAERLSLWGDDEALEVCKLHWAAFARRYKGIPNSRLSFNLFNEPSGVSEAEYFRVVKEVCEAIRKEDPGRLIIADGLCCGSSPCFSLKELKVAQATRGYAPFELTHYKAEWSSFAGKVNPPSWPKVKVAGYLFGPDKEELQAPFLITIADGRKLKLRLRIDTVSDSSKLDVKADGRTVLLRSFMNGSGKGEWKEAIFKPLYGKYQNIYGVDVIADIPEGTKTVSLENTEGDWMSVSEIGFGLENGAEYKIYPELEWKWNPVKLDFDPSGDMPFKSNMILDRQWLMDEAVLPWKQLQERGVGVFVGEFGSYNKTPHDVVLAWMEDCLKNWKDAGWGWALWNFRGSFGILDSERKDVKYEDFKGHKLDRKMLELLRKY